MSNFEVPNPAADANSQAPQPEPHAHNTQVPPAGNVPPAGAYYQQAPYSQPRPNRFYAQLRSLPWRRANDGWLGGIAQAMSRQYGWDVALVRGVIIVAGVFAAPFALFVYALAWALIPAQQTEKIELEEFLAGRFNGSQAVIGIALFLALSTNVLHFNLGIFDSDGFFTGPLFVFGSFGFVLTLIAIMIALVLMSEKRSRDNLQHNPHNPPLNNSFPPSMGSQNFTASTEPSSSESPTAEMPVSMAVPPVTPTSVAFTPQQPAFQPTAPLPFYNPRFAETPITPAPPRPLYYAPTAQPAPTPEKWGKGPGLATFLGMTGFLVLFGTVAFYLTTDLADAYMVPDIAFPIALLGMGFVMAGVVLAYLAFSGRKGTWLTGLTIFLAICSPGFIGALVEAANNNNFHLNLPF
ncbi:hypothetical protein HMPREF0044_0579 [Gleimia coleocanis DSM 15436]|uniref:Phage shock protein PspC N-terminal domain-containing protein n=1 Tax=Gleimia coleocanis DSM 15436 TaxID=525245 RepID=C0VZI9_9ACTO|nr:PspC domain-containing protein [Gleimia coleocanis]EEH64108.1 hypothetical protein HMPREF0044_0579 [Gleimia coleocanis DSM 15436]